MTRPYLLAGYAMPPIKRFVRSKRSVRITRTSTGYPMSPTAPRIATRLSWVFADAGSTTNRSMSLSLVICPVAADPNRMILSGRATVRTRRTTSFSSVSSTFIQFHHTQSRPQLHERCSSLRMGEVCSKRGLRFQRAQRVAQDDALPAQVDQGKVVGLGKVAPLIVGGEEVIGTNTGVEVGLVGVAAGSGGALVDEVGDQPLGGPGEKTGVVRPVGVGRP